MGQAQGGLFPSRAVSRQVNGSTLSEAFSDIIIKGCKGGLNQPTSNVCELAESSALAKYKDRVIRGSTSFCDCWCMLLPAATTEITKSSQKLWSPIGDPKMIRFGYDESPVIVS